MIWNSTQKFTQLKQNSTFRAKAFRRDPLKTLSRNIEFCFYCLGGESNVWFTDLFTYVISVPVIQPCNNSFLLQDYTSKIAVYTYMYIQTDNKPNYKKTFQNIIHISRCWYQLQISFSQLKFLNKILTGNTCFLPPIVRNNIWFMLVRINL